MTRKTSMWRRYLTFWRRDIDGDLCDEVEFHIEARTCELIEAGWPPEAAAAEAQRQFGNRDAIMRECHQIDMRFEKEKSMMRHLRDLEGDIQFAFRQFFSHPVFSTVPPDLEPSHLAKIPFVLLGRGLKDEWYTAEKLARDEERLRTAGVNVEIVTSAGGHEWSEEFRGAASRFLSQFSAGFSA